MGTVYPVIFSRKNILPAEFRGHDPIGFADYGPPCHLQNLKFLPDLLPNQGFFCHCLPKSKYGFLPIPCVNKLILNP